MLIFLVKSLYKNLKVAIHKVLKILKWLKYIKIRVVISTFLANKALKRLYLRFYPETL